MPEPEIDLLSVNGGVVTAPAGCGKTHLIASALTRQAERKPILVLTHTNAGVAALRGRLDKLGVPPKSYRLATIDGWAMRLISTFPQRSGHNPDILTISNPGAHYPEIRRSAAVLLRDKHVNDVLASSYSRMFVDEYQDCSEVQHALCYFAAKAIPAAVLGDPMQGIFGFGTNTLVDWDQAVCQDYQPAGELSTPWRWINDGEEDFGRWLLWMRQELISGRPVDLTKLHPNAQWVHLDGVNDHELRLQAARTPPPPPDGKVIIIGDSTSPTSQRQFASQTPGAVTVESVDLRDLVTFAKDLDLNSGHALTHVVTFAGSVMTNTAGANLLKRVATLRAGTERKDASVTEEMALRFAEAPSYKGARNLLSAISAEPGVRTHRPAILRGCFSALQLAETQSVHVADAAVTVREQSRLIGRPLAKRTVGSTLLLKGLEAEVCVVLDPSVMDRKHLYVAMTRGSKRLVLCSRLPTLTPG